MQHQSKSVAVMQPYFLPYLGYFSLIDSVEHYMFFDDVQFLRKSWMSRNRLLNMEKEEDFYIRPDLIKPKYQELLPNVKLNPDEKWKNKLLAQINFYKNKTPYFKEVKDLLEKILAPKYEYLVNFNIQSIVQISNALQLDTKFDRYTDYDFWFDKKPGPDEWGLFVAREIGATRYINAPGGEEFIKAKQFQENNISLGFIQPKLEKYDQKINGTFKPGLSILDVLFFNGCEKTKIMVKNYNIKWKN